MAVGQVIGKSEFFSELGEGELGALARIALERRFRPDEVVFSEGEKAGGFYILGSGRVKIYKLSGSGREQILRIVEPGEMFGEAAVFEGRAFPAFARALEESGAVFFPAAEFRAAVESNPALAMGMLAAMARQLRRFAALVEQLTLRDARSRLAEYLLNAPADAEGKITLDITKRELASHLGTKPETLSRALSVLQAEGAISVDGPVIEIVDTEGLERVAGGID